MASNALPVFCSIVIYQLGQFLVFISIPVPFIIVRYRKGVFLLRWTFLEKIVRRLMVVSPEV